MSQAKPIYSLILNTLKILARTDMEPYDKATCISNLKRVSALVERNMGA